MRYVLDASAILLYLMGLDGADEVDRVLDRAIVGGEDVYICHLSLAEVYAAIADEFGVGKATNAIAAVRRWPVEFVPVDEVIALAAGRIMVVEEVSLEDAVALAVAKDRSATLLTANPSLRDMDGVRLIGGKS